MYLLISFEGVTWIVLVLLLQHNEVWFSEMEYFYFKNKIDTLIRSKQKWKALWVLLLWALGCRRVRESVQND